MGSRVAVKSGGAKIRIPENKVFGGKINPITKSGNGLKGVSIKKAQSK